MKTNPLTKPKGISVGQLVKLCDRDREALINSLPIESRMKLAHLANIAIGGQVYQLEQYQKLTNELTRMSS